MATVHTKQGIVEIPDSDPRIQAHNALRIAAERIGRANYASGLYRNKRIVRGRMVTGYYLTDAHEDVVAAMPKVLDGTISPDEAMNLLRRCDVMEQRLAG